MVPPWYDDGSHLPSGVYRVPYPTTSYSQKTLELIGDECERLTTNYYAGVWYLDQFYGGSNPLHPTVLSLQRHHD